MAQVVPLTQRQVNQNQVDPGEFESDEEQQLGVGDNGEVLGQNVAVNPV